MKPLRDREEVKEVDSEETSQEEEPGGEDQENTTTVMSKAIWLDNVLIRGNHGALTAELMGTQLKTS
jgi:hypothetical protein